jgi:hypothetical protein
MPGIDLLTRARRAGTAGAAAVLLAAAVGGCTSSTAGPSSSAYPIDTRTPPSGACAGVEVDPMEVGADTAARGPIWGQAATDPTAKKLPLVWPTGFTARLAPDGKLQVLDPTGLVVVAEGGQVRHAQLCRLSGDLWLLQAFAGFGLPTESP